MEWLRKAFRRYDRCVCKNKLDHRWVEYKGKRYCPSCWNAGRNIFLLLESVQKTMRKELLVVEMNA